MISAKRLLWTGFVIAAVGAVITIVGYFRPIGIWGLIGSLLALIGAAGTLWQGLQSAREGGQLRERERAQRRMMSGRPDYDATFETMRPPPSQRRKSFSRSIWGS
jgi:hypothetical protein